MSMLNELFDLCCEDCGEPINYTPPSMVNEVLCPGCYKERKYNE